MSVHATVLAFGQATGLSGEPRVIPVGSRGSPLPTPRGKNVP